MCLWRRLCTLITSTFQWNLTYSSSHWEIQWKFICSKHTFTQMYINVSTLCVYSMTQSNIIIIISMRFKCICVHAFSTVVFVWINLLNFALGKIVGDVDDRPQMNTTLSISTTPHCYIYKLPQISRAPFKLILKICSFIEFHCMK